MTWTNVTKAPKKAWTNSNTIGTQQYDDPTLLYDDPNNFYDSYNAAAWTNIAKPSDAASSIQTAVAGSPIGLLLALTNSQSSSVVTSRWISIPKAL